METQKSELSLQEYSEMVSQASGERLNQLLSDYVVSDHGAVLVRPRPVRDQEVWEIGVWAVNTLQTAHERGDLGSLFAAALRVYLLVAKIDEQRRRCEVFRQL